MSVSTTSETGRKSNIGTTAVQMTTDMTKSGSGVVIFSDSGNSTLYVGTRNSITADSDDATDGFPVAAGGSLTLEVRNPSDIYIIAASGTTNKVWWLIV